jgi:thioesterase domain-containing protein
VLSFDSTCLYEPVSAPVPPGARPLFLVHPAPGDIGEDVDLLTGAGDCPPVLGIQMPGWHGAPPRPWTVPMIAARYLRDVRRFQPEGPYLLGGYCTGGHIAYEMGRQLREAGAEVSSIVLLDCVISTPLLDTTPQDGLRTLVERRLTTLRMSPTEPIREAVHRVGPEYLIDLVHRGPAALTTEAEEEFFTIFGTYWEFVTCCARYTPPPTDLALDVVLSSMAVHGEETEGGNTYLPGLSADAVEAEWRSFTSGAVTPHRVRCSHDTMLASRRVRSALTEICGRAGIATGSR